MSDRIALELTPTPRHARKSEGGFVTLTIGRIVFVYSRFAGNTGDHGHAQPPEPIPIRARDVTRPRIHVRRSHFRGEVRLPLIKIELHVAA